MSLKAIIRAEAWHRVVDALEGLTVDDAIFEVTPDGLELRVFSYDKVAAVDLRLHRHDHEWYDFPDPKPNFQFGVRTYALRILKRAGKKDLIKIELKDDSDYLEATIKGEKKETRFSIPLLTLEEVTSLPDVVLSFTASVKLFAGILRKVLEDINAVLTDEIRISAHENEVVLKGKGYHGESTVILRKEEFEINVKESTEGIYSLERLKAFLKGVPPPTYVALSFATKKPLRLFMPVLESSAISFYLAPRVEE